MAIKHQSALNSNGSKNPKRDQMFEIRNDEGESDVLEIRNFIRANQRTQKNNQSLDLRDVNVPS